MKATDLFWALPPSMRFGANEGFALIAVSEVVWFERKLSVVPGPRGGLKSEDRRARREYEGACRRLGVAPEW